MPSEKKVAELFSRIQRHRDSGGAWPQPETPTLPKGKTNKVWIKAWKKPRFSRPVDAPDDSMAWGPFLWIETSGSNWINVIRNELEGPIKLGHYDVQGPCRFFGLPGEERGGRFSDWCIFSQEEE